MSSVIVNMSKWYWKYNTQGEWISYNSKISLILFDTKQMIQILNCIPYWTVLSSSNKRENTDLIDGAPSTGRDKIVSSDQTNTAEYLKLEGQKKVRIPVTYISL